MDRVIYELGRPSSTSLRVVGAFQVFLWLNYVVFRSGDVSSSP